MSQITNGSATFSRTVKTGEFENKKAEARLDFTVGDGEDYVEVFDRAAKGARLQVHAMLGIADKVKEEKPAAPATPTATNDKTKLAEAVTGGKPGEVVTEGKPAAEKKQRGAKPPKPADAGVDVVTEQPKAADTDEDIFGPTTPATPARTIADQELSEVCREKNKEINDTVAIRGVMAQFGGGPPPLQLRNIPQEKRQAFIDAVKALKPAAKAA